MSMVDAPLSPTSLLVTINLKALRKSHIINKEQIGENVLQVSASCENGAGDRDRTGDVQLGKLAFYR
jgi:hypothetical protein